MTREEQRRAAMTSLNYPPGTRLELISMGKDPDPVPPGTRGTVERVNSYGDIEMSWDTMGRPSQKFSNLRIRCPVAEHRLCILPDCSAQN